MTKADELIAQVRAMDPARDVSLGRVERRIERSIAARSKRGVSLFVALALGTAGAAAAMIGVDVERPAVMAADAPLPTVSPVRQRRVMFVRQPLVAAEPVRAPVPPMHGFIADHGPAQTSSVSTPIFEEPSIEAPLPSRPPPSPPPFYVPRGVRELGYVP